MRREYRRELGAAPVVVYVAGCYAVPAVLGRPVQEGLLPFGGPKEAGDSPGQPPDTEKPP